jgi:hypothetical protein
MTGCGAISTTSATAAGGSPARPSERKAFALLRERVRAASLANSGPLDPGALQWLASQSARRCA